MDNMDKKKIFRVLPVLILIIVSIAVFNGNSKSNREAQIFTVRAFVEAINDRNKVYAEKFILMGTSESGKLVERVEKGDIEQLEIISIKKSDKKFEPVNVTDSSGKDKVYRSGAVLDVQYEAVQKHQGEPEGRKKLSRVYTLVKVKNGVYRIYSVE